MSIFTVEISQPSKSGVLNSAMLELPATWSEYQDAMEKARITDDFRRIYTMELCDCRLPSLQNKIPQPIHLQELNLLAQRLDGFSKQETGIFGAMVAIEAKQNPNGIPLSRLINLTHSINNCHVAYGVHSEKELGSFLLENDMLPDDVHEFALLRLPTEGDHRLKLLGARHLERESGVFSSVGYVEMESVNEVYVPSNTTYFQRSGAPVVLSVCKGFFNDPSYENGITITLDLPAPQQTVDDVVESVGAVSWTKCGWHCTDCLIPAAKELINDSADFETVERFAKALADMERHTLPSLYKAMFEAVKPPDLESATALVAEVEQYTLQTEISGPEDYARAYLSRMKDSDDRIDLPSLTNLYALGERVMKLENAEGTPYGVLQRKDGAPIQSQECGPESGMEMR